MGLLFPVRVAHFANLTLYLLAHKMSAAASIEKKIMSSCTGPCWVNSYTINPLRTSPVLKINPIRYKAKKLVLGFLQATAGCVRVSVVHMCPNKSER